MRCPDCGKFVSYDTDVEPEEQDDPQYDGTTVTVEVRRVLACADCGDELKEAMIELEADVQIEHTQECLDFQDDDGYYVEPEYEVEADYSSTERTQEKDRHGKPIRNPRYRRTYYGVEVTGKVRCLRCEAEAEFSADNEEQASGFEELV